MGRIFLWPLLVVGASLIYLQVVGVPGAWAGRFLREIEERGLSIDTERISLDVLRGVVLHRCRIYDEPTRDAPLLEAAAIALRLDPRAWFKGQLGLRGVTIKDGVLILGSAEPGNEGSTFRLDRLYGGLAFGPRHITVNDLSVRCLGVDVRGIGRIDMHAAGPLNDDKMVRTSDPRALRRALRKSPPWLAALVDQLKDVSFAVPPKAEVSFVLRPGIRSGSLIHVQADGGHTVVRGLVFDGWSFKGSVKGSRVECERAFARSGRERIEAEGSYSLERRVVEARLDSTLLPTYLEGLMPVRWRDRLDQTGLFFSGPVRVEVQLGPAAPERLSESFSGRLRVRQAELRHVFVERADLRFQVHGNRLVVPGFEALIGKDEQQGVVRGQVEVALDTKAYHGQLHAEFDWIELLPVLTPGLSRLVRSMQFDERPPIVDAEFSGRPGQPELFKLEGDLRGKALFYNGSYVDVLRSDLTMDRRVLTLGGLRAEREEGYVEGSVAVDFRERRVDLDLYTTVDPPAAARTGGEALARIVSAFRFEGPTETTIRGSVYWGPNGVTDLTAQARGRKMGLKWFLADEASFDLFLKGRDVLVTNLVLKAYGGDGDGTVKVTPDGDRWRYTADLRAHGMAYGEMMRQATQRAGETGPGRLKMDTALTGLVGDDFLHNLTGRGRVEITEARLLQVPLFGGLSRGLSSIFPGLGFSKQTDFRASYKIEDQRIYTDDVKLEGPVVSLAADGYYGLETKDLHFKVEVRLLREQGVASSVVHLVTSPLSKLLQFDLRGTFEEPRWRPNNLPKEMFLIFE